MPEYKSKSEMKRVEALKEIKFRGKHSEEAMKDVAVEKNREELLEDIQHLLDVKKQLINEIRETNADFKKLSRERNDYREALEKCSDQYYIDKSHKSWESAGIAREVLAKYPKEKR